MCTAQDWNDQAAPIWELPWKELSTLQRSAASSLGYRENTWGRVCNPELESSSCAYYHDYDDFDDRFHDPHNGMTLEDDIFLEENWSASVDDDWNPHGRNV